MTDAGVAMGSPSGKSLPLDTPAQAFTEHATYRAGAPYLNESTQSRYGFRGSYSRRAAQC